MAKDHEDTETRTQEELADLRRLKFGHLPARVRSEDLVETAETDPVQEEAEQPMVRREWG